MEFCSVIFIERVLENAPAQRQRFISVNILWRVWHWAPLNVGGGRGGLNVLFWANVSTIQLSALEQYSIWEGRATISGSLIAVTQGESGGSG